MFNTAIYVLLDINECASNPCQNGGTCVDEVNRYSCSCYKGYKGTNCEKGNSNISISMQAHILPIF